MYVTCFRIILRIFTLSSVTISPTVPLSLPLPDGAMFFNVRYHRYRDLFYQHELSSVQTSLCHSIIPILMGVRLKGCRYMLRVFASGLSQNPKWRICNMA